MNIPEDAVLVRIFVGEQDMHQRIPLYEAIVMKAREQNIAGATVLKGVMGYGASSRVHTTKILRLSEDMPMVIELVDSEAHMQPLLQWLETVVDSGLITMEKIRVHRYGNRNKS